MYKTCPKCGHEAASSNLSTCQSCGLVYAKWLRNQYRSNDKPMQVKREAQEASAFSGLLAQLLDVSSRTDPIYFYGRCLVWAVLLFWGWSFILMDYASNEAGHSFLHNINLVFHEFGHVLFRPFGEFMMFLGGSLFQVVMPLILLGAFVKQHNNFGAAVCLWWAGQSLIDVAPYIADAQSRKLMLLTGGTGQQHPGSHDWFNILFELDLLQSDQGIAAFSHYLGATLIIISLAWSLILLNKQRQQPH